MGWKIFINVRLVLIMACTAMFASQASAKCYEISNSKGFDAHTNFTLCDDQSSQIRLNVQEVMKHPEISGLASPGDIAISVQSASVDVETVNGSGWGGRGGFYVPLPDHDDALHLARAINAGEMITISASNKSTGETHTVFSGVFAMTFPAEYLSSNAEEEAPAPVVSSTPKKVEQKPYPVSDLPPGLTSVTLIPFKAGKEEEWREAYLSDVSAGSRNLIDRSCEAAAYPYRRAHSYWHRVAHDLERLNASAPNKLTRESAASLCADERASAEFRSQLLHHPKDTFDRLCEVMRSPGSYRMSGIGLVHETACYDLAAIRDHGQDQCMRSYVPNMSEAEKQDYCGCVGDKQAEYFADGTKKMRSTTLVEAGTSARGACKNPGTAQQTTTSSVLKAKAEPVKPVPKPAPAKAQPASTAGSFEDEAVKAIDDAADQIKKGLGSLFD